MVNTPPKIAHYCTPTASSHVFNVWTQRWTYVCIWFDVEFKALQFVFIRGSWFFEWNDLSAAISYCNGRERLTRQLYGWGRCFYRSIYRKTKIRDISPIWACRVSVPLSNSKSHWSCEFGILKRWGPELEPFFYYCWPLFWGLSAQTKLKNQFECIFYLISTQGTYLA